MTPLKSAGLNYLRVLLIEKETREFSADVRVSSKPVRYCQWSYLYCPDYNVVDRNFYAPTIIPKMERSVSSFLLTVGFDHGASIAESLTYCFISRMISLAVI